MKHPQRLELRLAELQRAPPAWKFCTVRSQERFDRENAQRADQAKMNGRRLKPRRGRPVARSARGRNRAVTTRKDQEEAEVLRGSLHGVARVLQAAQLHLRLQEAVLLPGCADGPEGHERAHQSEPAHQSEHGFKQQNRFRNLQNTEN